MRGINRVLLVGNLTRDPELSHTQGGTAVTKFSIASNSREKNGEEWVDYASFFDVTVFGYHAEACAEHLAKGRLVGVDGRLRQDRWKDRETQKNREKIVVIADNVQFLDSRGRDGGPPGGGPSDDPPLAPDDDIPF